MLMSKMSHQGAAVRVSAQRLWRPPSVAGHARPLRSIRAAVSQQMTVEVQQQYYPLPRNVQEMVDEASAAVQRACSAQSSSSGQARAIITMINPVNEKAISFLSTEATDYPTSNFSEFQVLTGLAKNFLARFTGNDDVALKVKRIDEGGIDGDLSCLVMTEDLSIVCVVWPTAGSLKKLKSLSEDKRIRHLFLLNPLWKTEGNLMSEFGIGPWRKANEEFVASFEPAYLLYEQRIGAPSSVNLAKGNRYESGGVVRVQRCFPGPYEVHIMAPNGVSQAVGKFAMSGGKPTYQALDSMITEGRKVKLEIFDVARKASSLALERGEAPPPSTSDAEEAAGDGASQTAFYSRDEILDMDIQRLRRVLLKLELPTSGAIGKLQARALAIADGISEGLEYEQAVKKAKALR